MGMAGALLVPTLVPIFGKISHTNRLLDLIQGVTNCVSLCGYTHVYLCQSGEKVRMRHALFRSVAQAGKLHAWPGRRYIAHIVALCLLGTMIWTVFSHPQVHAISFD